MATLFADSGYWIALLYSRDQYVEIVGQTTEQFRAAMRLYAARLDQSWSLTDCASFIVMEERGITDALAYDRDFEQAGFTALLRTPAP